MAPSQKNGVFFTIVKVGSYQFYEHICVFVFHRQLYKNNGTVTVLCAGTYLSDFFLSNKYYHCSNFDREQDAGGTVIV